MTRMKSVQRGKSPRSIASKRSRPLLSRSFATTASEFAVGDHHPGDRGSLCQVFYCCGHIESPFNSISFPLPKDVNCQIVCDFFDETSFIYLLLYMPFYY